MCIKKGDLVERLQGNQTIDIGVVLLEIKTKVGKPPMYKVYWRGLGKEQVTAASCIRGAKEPK